METKKTRLHELLELAIKHNLVKDKGSFARFIGIDSGTLSHALKDDGKVNLDNTITKAEMALTKAGVQPFGEQPKQGDADWFALVAEKDKQISRLLTIIEKMQG